MTKGMAVAIPLAVFGVVCTIGSGDVWFAVIGIGAGIVMVAFKKIVRTVLWAGLATYATFAFPPYGWILALALIIICASLPWTRGVTPMADFGKSKS